jgi:hypothetical protein
LGSKRRSDESTHHSCESISVKAKKSSRNIKKLTKQQLREEERLICKSKGRKTSQQQQILLKAFQKYNGKWDEDNFR